MRMLFLWRVIAVLLAGASAGFAAEKPLDIDAAADRVMRNVATTMGAAKTAEVDLGLTINMEQAPVPQGNLVVSYALAIERPNKLAMALKEGTLGATVVSDGTNSTMFIPPLKAYTVQPAPKDLSGLDYDASSPTGDMGSMAFIAALFSGDPYKSLLAGVKEARHAGREKIGEVECDRVNLQQDGLEWSLFTTSGTQAVVRRIAVAIPQLKMTMDFTGWKFNAAIPADRFKFTPPEGTKKVASLTQEETAEEGADSELIGEKMPEFILKTVEGGAFNSSSLEGRPTILVVWGGEAEHCLSVLRVAGELASKDVAIHAINIDEKPDKARIKGLFNKQKMTGAVALDPKHEAVEALEIDGVPMTFLIDQAGVIRKAFLGFHANFKSILTRELQALGK